MLRTLWHRALAGIAVVAGVLTLTFLLLHAAPGDPAERLLGPTATPEQVAALRHTLELDRPLAVQYAGWLGRFVHGDWGTSIATGRPAWAMLREAWPATARVGGDRRGRHGALRARRDARRHHAAVRGGGPRQRARRSARPRPARAAQRPRPPAHPARPFAPSPVLGRRVRRSGVRVAGGRPRDGRGGSGPGLPRCDGRDRSERCARRDGEHPRRYARHLGGPARAQRGPGGLMRLRDRRAAFGVAVLAVVAVAAVAAPLVTAGNPNAQGDIVATRFLPPFAAHLHGTVHPLGTDRFGRDVWTRLVYGARISLGVGVLAVLISVVIGTAVGATAGYLHGWPATALLAFTDFALALPRVVLLLLLAALWRPSAALVVVVLGVTGWMPIARVVHGEVRGVVGRRAACPGPGCRAPAVR